MNDYKSKVGFIYLISFFTDLLNMYISSIAFPVMQKELHASIDQLSWIANIYALGLALIIPLSGYFGNKYGTKKVFISALIVFLLGSTMCGLSTNIYQLIFWRFIQGLGGGVLIPVGQTITYRVFPNNQRAKLTAIVMGVAAIAPAISPTLGGIIIQYLSWPWLFFFNIPLTIITIVLACIWLKEEKNADAVGKLDVLAIGLISIGLFLFLYGLSYFKTIQELPKTCLILFGGSLSLFLFSRQTLKSKNALFDLRILKNNFLIKAIIVYIFVVGSFAGINILNIYFFQDVLGINPIKTGMLMITYSVGICIALILSSKHFNRIGPKHILLAGFIIFAIGMASLACIFNAQVYWIGFVSFFLMGFGGGMCTSSAQVLALLTIPNPQMSDASVIWNLNRQLCFSFGIALFSMLMILMLNHCGVTLTDLDKKDTLTTIFHTCFLIGAISIIIPYVVISRLDNKIILHLLNK